MLIRLANALRAVGRGSSEERLDQIKTHAPSLDPTLRRVIETSPGAIFRVLSDLIVALSEYNQDPGLMNVLLVLGTDPRNFREAAKTLERLDKELSGHPIKAKLEEGLEVLEENGALGLENLENLATFFVSLQRRPHQLGLVSSGRLRVGDAFLNIEQLINLQGALELHSVMWGRKAAFDVMGEQFGATEEAREWTRQEGTLPEVFAVSDAVSLLREWSMVQLPSVSTDTTTENARRLYFALYAVEKLMQPEWWGRFQPDLVFDETRTDTVYDPVRRSVMIGTDVAPISSVIEALLMAVDHNLMDYKSFASETQGSPVQLFVGMLGPLYGTRPDRESFARFGEHYLRIYLNQTGEPYAPLEADNDPPGNQVGGLSRTFMDSLVESQKIDLLDEIGKHAVLEQHNLSGSLVGAGALIAAGAEILPGI